MQTNDTFTKVFHKEKTEASYERSKAKEKEPTWKQEQRKQQKKNWNFENN